MYPRTLKVLVAALLLAATGVALAGQIEPDDRAEIAAVRQAAVIPTQAVRAAEADGGVAYAYGMEVDHGQHWYKVDVRRGTALETVRVDATSGKVIDRKPAHGEDALGAHALDASGLTLAAAIAHAEREGKGPALEAETGGHGAAAHADVDVIQDAGRQVAHYRVSMQGHVVQATLTGTDR